MKWIILLALITACGKHTEPGYKDMRDSDGDQIFNYEEKGELNKWVADVAPIEDIKASLTLKFGQIEVKDITFELTNSFELKRHSKELMVRNLDILPKENYFSEWSALRLNEKKTINLPSDQTFRVDLVFNKLTKNPDFLQFHFEGKLVQQWPWETLMHISLTRDELTALLEGKAYFGLGRKQTRERYFQANQSQTIKEATYRVYVNNEKKTDIFYVSKELPFKDFLKLIGISTFRLITEENLLTTTHKTSIPEWWVRDINENDKVVVKDDLRNLADFYKEGFDKKKVQLSRVNGSSGGNLAIVKNKNAQVMLKIRPQLNRRSFKAYTKKESHRDGGGGGRRGDGGGVIVKCEVKYRDITSVTSVYMDEEYLLNSLRVRSGSTIIALENLVTEVKHGEDETGFYYEIFLQTELEGLSVNISDSLSTEYLQVGRLTRKCDGSNPKFTLQHPEASMKLNIEAYVEKL